MEPTPHNTLVYKLSCILPLAADDECRACCGDDHHSDEQSDRCGITGLYGMLVSGCGCDLSSACLQLAFFDRLFHNLADRYRIALRYLCNLDLISTDLRCETSIFLF